MIQLNVKWNHMKTMCGMMIAVWFLYYPIYYIYIQYFQYSIIFYMYILLVMTATIHQQIFNRNDAGNFLVFFFLLFKYLYNTLIFAGQYFLS